MSAWGAGPAYPVIPDAQDLAILRFEFPPPVEFGEWAVRKVMWVVASGFKGRVLIRGGQLGGDGEVRFEAGMGGFPLVRDNPAPALRLQGPGGFPATTRVQKEGCYAYQLDTRTRSVAIVFQAVKG